MQQQQAEKSEASSASVVIIGSGFAGLGTAIRLKKAGIHDFVLLEKDDDLGGTWRDNTYPGCACDVPSVMYSFSFEQNPEWSRTFAGQQEIRDYLEWCADIYGVREHIRYGAKFTGAEWDDDTRRWSVHLADGRVFIGKAVVSGLGVLHIPSYPNLPGLERFQGEAFHSADWNHDYDLAGKRVAVIGTGASAIQFVPQIAKEVDQLHLFQRTPPWIQPKPDHPVPRRVRKVFRRVPLVQKLTRVAVYWVLELRSIAVLRNRFLQRIAQWATKRYIRKQVRDPEVRKAVTPDYSMGCKRILLSNDFYPSLNRSNVALHTGGVREVTENAVIDAAGRVHEVDAVIFGTGFHVTDAFDELAVTGRGGRKLQDAWADGMEAYLGMTVSGFPNLFFLLGPNTGLGHNSVVFMIESQLNHVIQCLKPIVSGEVDLFDVRRSVQDEFNEKVQQNLADAVWSSGGCQSWYLDENGVNRTLWPGFSWTYWAWTRKLDRSDYEVAHADHR